MHKVPLAIFLHPMLNLADPAKASQAYFGIGSVSGGWAGRAHAAGLLVLSSV